MQSQQHDNYRFTVLWFWKKVNCLKTAMFQMTNAIFFHSNHCSVPLQRICPEEEIQDHEVGGHYVTKPLETSRSPATFEAQKTGSRENQRVRDRVIFIYSGQIVSSSWGLSILRNLYKEQLNKKVTCIDYDFVANHMQPKCMILSQIWPQRFYYIYAI